MARPRHDFTLSPETAEYLKQFDNKSKIVDEAIELHKNKDKMILNQKIPNFTIKKVIA